MLEPRIAAAYDAWRAQPGLPEDLAAELASIQGDEEAITDRFYRELAFGTGGLRGVIGAGLADYLNASGLPKKAAIGYDSRIKSDVFARETACVLAANGITAYLYPRLEPTPSLSWAVRYYGCGAGVCVTASHNPAKYNGYKVPTAARSPWKPRTRSRRPSPRWTALRCSPLILTRPWRTAASSTVRKPASTPLWTPFTPSGWGTAQASRT